MNKDLATIPVKNLVESDTIKNKFNEVLGQRAPQFISSLVNVVNSNQSLQKVDQTSVISSALVAASLNLPVDPNLGYMYIVPYGGKAQPQMGYKGYIQLAQRSGSYKHLNAIAVYEDEFKGFNPLTEELLYTPDFKDRDKEQPVGYVGYFELANGFEKTVYWTRKQIDDHRQRFSKSGGKAKPSGVWASDFDAMALKTVLRNLISKWGPMTIDMQKAVVSDEEQPETIQVEATESEKKDQLASKFKAAKNAQEEPSSTDQPEPQETNEPKSEPQEMTLEGTGSVFDDNQTKSE